MAHRWSIADMEQLNSKDLRKPRLRSCGNIVNYYGQEAIIRSMLH